MFATYDTNHPQLKRYMHLTLMSHACDTSGVNHSLVGFLDSTRLYTHTQYLHTLVFCIANVAS